MYVCSKPKKISLCFSAPFPHGFQTQANNNNNNNSCCVLQGDATPTLFVAVKGLPKDALIEKQVLYHTGRGFSAADEEEESGDTAHLSCPPIYSTGIVPRCSYQNEKKLLI